MRCKVCERTLIPGTATETRGTHAVWLFQVCQRTTDTQHEALQ